MLQVVILLLIASILQQEFNNNGYTIFLQYGYTGYPGGAYRSWDFTLPITLQGGGNITVVCNAVGSYNINAASIKILGVYNTHFTMQYTGAGNNSGSIGGVEWLCIGH